MKSVSMSKRTGKGTPITVRSPKRQAALARAKATMFASPMAERAGAKPSRVSWWTPFADPSVAQAPFYEAAHAHDRAMQSNAEWQRPAKLQQIGQL